MQKITKKMLVSKAEELGLVKIKSLKKTALIHKIQSTEGNNPCFQTIPDCSVSPCLYRQECIK
ncbi:MAG: hypothetical protein Q9M28_01585 [Mariprofundaceae bacterium]|nr:hypothetical protein [Mariprofundaceae bacterium]